MKSKQQYRCNCRYLTFLFILNFLISIFFSIPFTPMVCADAVDIQLVAWESWYPDTTSGDNLYMNWSYHHQHDTYAHDYETARVVGKTGFTGNQMLYMGYNGRSEHSGASVWIDFSDYTKNLTDYNTWCYGVVVKVYDYWGYDGDDSSQKHIKTYDKERNSRFN